MKKFRYDELQPYIVYVEVNGENKSKRSNPVFVGPDYSVSYDENKKRIFIKDYSLITNKITEIHEAWEQTYPNFKEWLECNHSLIELDIEKKDLKSTFDISHNVYEVSYSCNPYFKFHSNLVLMTDYLYSFYLTNNLFHVISFYDIEQKKKHVAPIHEDCILKV